MRAFSNGRVWMFSRQCFMSSLALNVSKKKSFCIFLRAPKLFIQDQNFLQPHKSWHFIIEGSIWVYTSKLIQEPLKDNSSLDYMWLMHFCKLHFIQTVIKSKGETGKQEKLWEGWIEPRSPGSYTCQIQERYQSTMGSRQFKQFVHLHAWLVKRRPPAEVNHCL